MYTNELMCDNGTAKCLRTYGKFKGAECTERYSVRSVSAIFVQLWEIEKMQKQHVKHKIRNLWLICKISKVKC